MNENLKKIANHFGHASQLNKISEESKELTEAADDYHQALVVEDDPIELAYAREHLIEEMADTLIMIKQVAYLECAEDELAEAVEQKTQRTLKRIKEGFYGNNEDA